jgi:hypothetical protein
VDTDIAAAMAAAMGGETRRRELASQRPGHGAQVFLPDVPAGPGVGISDVPMPMVGEGLPVAPVPSGARVAAYVVPAYADDIVGGIGFVGGRNEAPIGVLTVSRSSLADAVIVASPPARPGLLARVLGRLRK